MIIELEDDEKIVYVRYKDKVFKIQGYINGYSKPDLDVS
jgi:hypothetical protein